MLMLQQRNCMFNTLIYRKSSTKLNRLVSIQLIVLGLIINQLNTDQVAVIKACVVAKQEEVDDVTAELKKLNGVLTQTREDLDK